MTDQIMETLQLWYDDLNVIIDNHKYWKPEQITSNIASIRNEIGEYMCMKSAPVAQPKVLDVEELLFGLREIREDIQALVDYTNTPGADVTLKAIDALLRGESVRSWIKQPAPGNETMLAAPAADREGAC